MSELEHALAQAIIIVAHVLGCDPENVKADDDMDSLQMWDSLAHMRLILRLEELYDREVDTDSIVDLVSVQAIGHYLSRLDNQ